MLLTMTENCEQSNRLQINSFHSIFRESSIGFSFKFDTSNGNNYNCFGIQNHIKHVSKGRKYPLDSVHSSCKRSLGKSKLKHTRFKCKEIGRRILIWKVWKAFSIAIGNAEQKTSTFFMEFYIVCDWQHVSCFQTIKLDLDLQIWMLMNKTISWYIEKLITVKW